jgi:YebC/PmpR family DNA-binding regulatory protein
MSGHSKWATIKRKKAATDQARGKMFSKYIKEITIAARHGGGDQESNPRLRTAVLAAKSVNMPAANIERAIKRGTGEVEGVQYEEAHYEGYAPGGVALLIEVATDNKNRTAGDIRHILTKHSGAMAEAGSVSYLFKPRGIIVIEKSAISE